MSHVRFGFAAGCAAVAMPRRRGHLSLANSTWKCNRFFSGTFFSPAQTYLALPRSGCVLQPRVAASATLGLKMNGRVNRNAVVAGCHNPDATPSGVGNDMLATQG